MESMSGHSHPDPLWATPELAVSVLTSPGSGGRTGGYRGLRGAGPGSSYLRRRGEAPAPAALNGGFIPQDPLWWATPPGLPPACEYCSVPTPGPPPPPQLGPPECHRGRVCGCPRSRGVEAGWEGAVAKTDTTGCFRPRSLPTNGGDREGPAARATSPGSQACTPPRHPSGRGSCEWGGGQAAECRWGMRGESFRTLAVGFLCPAPYN